MGAPAILSLRQDKSSALEQEPLDIAKGPESGSLTKPPLDSSSIEPLGGVLVIMQTPFEASLEIDRSSLQKEADFLVRCGVHGVVWPAAASELMSLSLEERLASAELIVRQVAGRVPVVIGVTAPNKFEAVAYASHAQDIGAAALLTLPQMDYQPTDPEMFDEYLCAITQRTDLPVIVQSAYPGAPSAFSPATMTELARRYPSFRYIKEEQVGQGPLAWRVSAHLARRPQLLVPIGGAGARNLLNEMARGSGGTMPGAGFADIQVQIWNAFRRGNTAAARQLFGRMLMMAVLEQSVGYVLQKEILRRRGVFATNTMRHTRRPLLDPGDVRELDAIFQELGPWLTT